MLRNAVLGFALIVLLVCALAVAAGIVGAWVPIIWCAIVAACIAFERYRYKPLEVGSPGPGWEKTGERFIDDETGKVVTVYIEKTTGERRYVRE
jgi:hypothetical protein